MKSFIAAYKAYYPESEVEQHSCISWKQNDSEYDEGYIKDLIINSSSIHYFNIFIDKPEKEKIIVDIITVEDFK